MFDNIKNTVSTISQIKDQILRNTFMEHEIGDILLSFVVVRRLDCILASLNEKIWAAYDTFKDKVSEDKLDPILRKAAGNLRFYNISKHTLESLHNSPRTINIDFINYLNGFNKEIKEILGGFQFDKAVARLEKFKLLSQVITAIYRLDLNKDKMNDHHMGYLFEELIKISLGESIETTGEYFTPRDVVDLMVRIVFSDEKEILSQPGIIRTIYDPAVGTGGMIISAKNYILDKLCTDGYQPEVVTYGQEINQRSYAIAKSAALITGQDTDNIQLGNILTADHFPGKHFNYILADPPFGLSWARDANNIRKESADPGGRFYAGLPAVADSQLLFLQHMISKMESDGSKIALITNGSPLFTGNAGGGESDIRKWIITNDWLDCIIALPKDILYNTGINTYLWLLNNKKSQHKRGKVQLINAAMPENKTTGVEGFCRRLQPGLSAKRYVIEDLHVQKLLNIYTTFAEGPYSKIINSERFGYYQVTIEQPEYGHDGKPVRDKKGNIKPDTKKRNKEDIPLTEDIEDYFQREVLPHVPDAWIDFDKTRIGYQIDFNSFFYEYKGPRRSAEIKVEIEALEFGSGTQKGITELLKELLA